jgi:hypothetical protein
MTFSFYPLLIVISIWMLKVVLLLSKMFLGENTSDSIGFQETAFGGKGGGGRSGIIDARFTQ